MLHYAATLRRHARAKADAVEAVAFGYAGVNGKDGARAMDRLLDRLRKP